MDSTRLKPRMTYDEIATMFAEEYPVLEPNPNLVSRYAKKIGYKWAKQQIKGKNVYFYVKADINTKIRYRHEI